MKHVMVRYKVKKGAAAEVKAAIERFVLDVKRHDWGTLSYDAFQEDDQTFVHVISFRDEKSERLHTEADHTNRFVDFLYPLCEKEPIFTELKLVGTTRQK